MKFRSRIYTDIIVEGHKRVLMEKQDFLEMFNDVIKLYGVVKNMLDEVGEDDGGIYFHMLSDTTSLHLQDAIKLQVEDVKKMCVRGIPHPETQKRQFAPDMTTWVLRYYKIADYYRLIGLASQIIEMTEDEENPKLTELAIRVRDLSVQTLNKMLFKFSKINPKFKEFMIEDPADEMAVMKADSSIDKIIDWTKRKLSHYVGMVHVNGIQNARFTDQWWNEIDEQFGAMETEWQKKMEEVKNVIPHDMSTGSEVIMKFPDGKYWTNLNRQHCDAEGKAMGHCGNNQHGGRSTGETVISLRQDVKMPDGRMGAKPMLSFILDKDGMLGETKARFNEKPGKEWHAYILELLKLPMIKGVKGGGYMPSNNFFIRELTYEDQVELYKVKPTMFGEEDKKALQILMKQEAGKNQATMPTQPAPNVQQPAAQNNGVLESRIVSRRIIK